MEMVPTNFNKKVFSTLDRDNDGGIGVEEFVTVSLRLAGQMNIQALHWSVIRNPKPSAFLPLS